MSIDHETLMRQAVAEDASGVLARAARDIDRVAGKVDAVSENTLRRIVAQLQGIAQRKRPRVAPRRVDMPGDVRDF